MIEKAALAKKRYGPRLPAHMAARIVAPGQHSPAQCFVREISPAGAKLEIDHCWVIPRTFWLRIDGDTDLHYCAVMWRNGLETGVEFRSWKDSAWLKYSRAVLNWRLPARARI